MDYKSPKDLADYHLYLSENSTAYNSYFKWRKFINFPKRSDPFKALCEMCIKLQLESYFAIEKGLIGDLGNYWSGNNACTDPSKYSITYLTFFKRVLKVILGNYGFNRYINHIF